MSIQTEIITANRKQNLGRVIIATLSACIAWNNIEIISLNVEYNKSTKEQKAIVQYEIKS